MLITINGIPGVGKSATCEWLTRRCQDIQWRQTDLGTTIRHLVKKGLNPLSPEDFVLWQRGFLQAVKMELKRRPQGICLLENGLEQIVGYSKAIVKLRSKDDSRWLDSWHILSQDFAEIRDSVASLTVVLTADISVVRARRRPRQYEPDYTGLREAEYELQSAFVDSLQDFAIDVALLDTTQLSVSEVGRLVAEHISQVLGHQILVESIA